MGEICMHHTYVQASNVGDGWIRERQIPPAGIVTVVVVVVVVVVAEMTKGSRGKLFTPEIPSCLVNVALGACGVTVSLRWPEITRSIGLISE
ncbi:hypothetical protein VM1G_01980 [Cytospora mali]|uniref:Uncharacterized protein n=1 Tax=Cytospora mali TaxID=578113 RepID=A0A194VNV2_CYTMA|nr:hypothetical protein VM1G_01980 [Valsa mali]